MHLFCCVWKLVSCCHQLGADLARVTSLSLLEARDPVVKGLSLLSPESQPASVGGWLPRARCFGGTYMIPRLEHRGSTYPGKDNTVQGKTPVCTGFHKNTNLTSPCPLGHCPWEPRCPKAPRDQCRVNEHRLTLGVLQWTHSQELSKNNYSTKLLGEHFFQKEKNSYFMRRFLGCGRSLCLGQISHHGHVLGV